MDQSRFTEEQIIRILQQQEAGAATAELCRKHRISRATLQMERNRHDPKAWLADVLARIAAHPALRLHELLPWN